MGVFDGMADIFLDTFGEGAAGVIYTPLHGSPITINAIWWETSLEVPIGVALAPADAHRTELSLREADVPDPKEGDTAHRISDGKIMTVTTPILRDGKGMVVCNLE